MGAETSFLFLYTKTFALSGSLTLAWWQCAAASFTFEGLYQWKSLFAHSHSQPLNNVHIIFWAGVVSIRAQCSPEIWPQLLMTAHQGGNHQPGGMKEKGIAGQDVTTGRKEKYLQTTALPELFPPSFIELLFCKLCWNEMPQDRVNMVPISSLNAPCTRSARIQFVLVTI